MAYIINSNSNTLVSGTSRNDTISNFGGTYVTISCGAGNDTVYNTGDKVTILGGKGNDNISSYGKKTVINYASGDGNDTIFGFLSSDTLHITNGNYSTIKSGSDVILKVGKNKIILKNSLSDSYSKINIKNSSGEVITYNDWKIRKGSVDRNDAENVTLAGSKKNDTIKNHADNVIIFGNSGNDSIENWSGENVKISGGIGADKIFSYGYHVTITGGKGNDSISIDNDEEIDYSKNTVIQYATGDGKDTIYGFNSDDTLQITKGSYKVSTKNNDVIVKVGSGSITLKDSVGQKISIKNSKGKVTTKTYGSSSANVAELFAENNFATADNLSEIVKNNLSATDYKIETQNFENLSQKNNLIAFTDK